jgi:hypothetical protein
MQAALLKMNVPLVIRRRHSNICHLESPGSGIQVNMGSVGTTGTRSLCNPGINKNVRLPCGKWN